MIIGLFPLAEVFKFNICAVKAPVHETLPLSTVKTSFITSEPAAEEWILLIQNLASFASS
jgi:hypothetical protein